MPVSPLLAQDVVVLKRANQAFPQAGSVAETVPGRGLWRGALPMTLKPLVAAVRAGGERKTGSGIPAIAGCECGRLGVPPFWNQALSTLSVLRVS
jgi:hypothetical protein